jgi:ribonucleoside-triphosphate reductase
LKVKRDTITKLLEAGLYPYTKRYLGTFNNHFSTIGLVGMNEACLNANWIRADLTTKQAQDFTKKVLNFMREKLSDYQELYGDLYNLEATPAESTSYRLAKHDRKRFPDIITASMDDNVPYYTNSSHLPVGYTDDIFKALDVQDELQTLYTSGTVFHAFLGQKLEDWKTTMNLVRKIAENYRLPYYTMSPTYSVCTTHGYITGEHYTCPECGKTTEVYSRITGYYRPVANWNDGKSQEFKQRKEYDIANSHLVRKHDENCNCEHNEIKTELVSSEKPLIFTTKTCPNCKMAKMLLGKAGIEYDMVDAQDNPELAKKYGVVKAPTMFVNVNGKQLKLENVSDIKKFIEETSKVGDIC